MGFINAVMQGYSDPFRIRGRANRTQFWSFFFFCGLFASALQLLNVIATKNADSPLGSIANLLGLVGSIFLFFTSLQLIAVTVRRYHDTNRSGWTYLGISIATPFFMVMTATIALASISNQLMEAVLNMPAGGADSTLDLAAAGPVLPLFGIASVIFFITQIYGLYLLLKAGDADANRFGARP